MGAGGKGKQPTETTQRIVNLPEFVDPYYKRMLKGAEESMLPFDPNTGESNYVPYGNERLTSGADYGDVMASRGMVRDIAGSGISGLGTAQEQFKSGIGAYGGMTGRLEDARMFDPAAAQQYMSPYMQNVVNMQKEGAIQDFMANQAGRDVKAVQAGAFGGSRQAVQQGVAEQNLAQRLEDIQTKGQQQAYQDAQKQFAADRAAQLQRQLEQAQFDVDVTGRGLDAAKGLVGLGELERGTDIESARMLSTLGGDIRAEDQARLDLAYQDFLTQRDYPMSQYERYAGLLSGVPVGNLDATAKTYQAYNPVQAALGTGLSALGLYRGMGGGYGGKTQA
jgi:hypothetical protein